MAYAYLAKKNPAFETNTVLLKINPHQSPSHTVTKHLIQHTTIEL